MYLYRFTNLIASILFVLANKRSLYIKFGTNNATTFNDAICTRTIRERERQRDRERVSEVITLLLEQQFEWNQMKH